MELSINDQKLEEIFGTETENVQNEDTFEVRSINKLKDLKPEGRESFEAFLLREQDQYVVKLDYDEWLKEGQKIKAIRLKQKGIYVSAKDGHTIIEEDLRKLRTGGDAMTKNNDFVLGGILGNKVLYDSGSDENQEISDFEGLETDKGRMKISCNKELQIRVNFPKNYILIKEKADLDKLIKGLNKINEGMPKPIKFQFTHMITEYVGEETEHKGREAVWGLNAKATGSKEYEAWCVALETKKKDQLSPISNYKSLNDVGFMFGKVVVNATCEKKMKHIQPHIKFGCEYR